MPYGKQRARGCVLGLICRPFYMYTHTDINRIDGHLEMEVRKELKAKVSVINAKSLMPSHRKNGKEKLGV